LDGTGEGVAVVGRHEQSSVAVDHRLAGAADSGKARLHGLPYRQGQFLRERVQRPTALASPPMAKTTAYDGALNRFAPVAVRF
jgi:hypothetical protein